MTSESVKDFSSFFKKTARELQEKNKYSNLEQLFKGLYNEALQLSDDVNSQENKDVVLQHLVLAPLSVNGISSFDSLGLSTWVSESFSALNDVSKLENLLGKYASFLEYTGPILIDEVPVKDVEVPTFINSAVHLDLHSTLGRETVAGSMDIDLNKQAAFNSIRSIISKIKDGSKDFKLKAVTHAYLMNTVDPNKLDYSLRNKPSSKESDRSHVSLVFTDTNGDILQFDHQGNVVVDGFVPLMQINTPTSINEAIYHYEKGIDNADSRYIRLKLDVYSKKTNRDVAINLAKRALEKQKSLFKNVISNDAGFVSLDISPDSTFGFTDDNSERTQLNNIKDIHNFNVIEEQQANDIFFSLSGSTLYDEKASIIPNDISSKSEVVDMIIKILLDNSLKMNGSSLSVMDKKELISNYVIVNDFSPLRINDKGNITIIISGKTEYNPSESMLRDFFNKITPISVVKENVENRKITKDLNDPNITSAYLYESPDGVLYKLYKPKFTFSKQSFSELKIDGNEITTSPVKKNDHIISNSSTKSFVNSDGVLKVYHPKISFDYTPNVIDLMKEISVLNSESMTEKELNDKAPLSWFGSSPLSSKIELLHSELLSNDRPEDRIAVARFLGNAIVLFKGSNNKDLYHEAWHGFSQGLLSVSDKQKLYNTVRSLSDVNKSFTDLQAEEFLADAFQDYAAGNKYFKRTTVIGKFFESILNYLKELFGVNQKNTLVYSSDLIKNHFKNLYTHNIDVSKYSPDNFMFKQLNKNLELKNQDGDIIKLSARQTALINETLDSLLTKYTDSNITSNLQSGYQSATSIMNAYKNALDDLIAIKSTQEALLKNETNDSSIKIFQEKIDALTASINNFGDLDLMFNNLDAKNTIGFHINNGNVFNIKDIRKSINIEDNVIDEDTTSAKLFERTGIDQSFFDMADKQILYVLNTIGKYETTRSVSELSDADLMRGKTAGKVSFSLSPVLNSLGVHILENKNVVLAKLGKLLNSTSNGDVMYDRMVNAAKTDPVIAEVLIKLGDYKSKNLTNVILWSKFIQTFSKSNNPLRQLIFERDNENVLTSKFGSSIGGTKSVERAWAANFNVIESSYIEQDEDGITLNVQNVLNDLVINKGSGRWEIKDKNNYVHFYRSIGFDITDNLNTEKELSDNSDIFEAICNRLKDNLNTVFFQKENNIPSYDKITSLSDLIGNHLSVDFNSNELIKSPGLNTYYNRLQKIEFDNSDKYNSFMAVNAEGETQSELSLNNTTSVIINELNEYEKGMSLDDIIYRAPHLEFLKDPSRQATKVYKSLFDKQGIRTANKLSFENFSGTSLIDGDDFLGTSNMNLDKESKFTTDVYLSYLGKSELPRMADKSTSMHIGISSVNYISPTLALDLLDNATDSTMYNALKDYLYAELNRINTLKTITTPFDQSYKSRGNSFFIFDDILSSDVKKYLMSNVNETGVENISRKIASLKFNSTNINDVLISEINNYFKKKTDESIQLNQDKLFLTNNMQEEILRRLNADLSDKNQIPSLTLKQSKEIAISMFERNKFMYNLDTMNFLLGDPALYNVAAEDFHKRNAGVISTGELFRTDKSFYEFINQRDVNGNIISRAWSNQVTKNRAYEEHAGVLNTAVISDHEIATEYLENIKSALGDNADLGDYTKMNEADGQGFITFDSYRLLMISQGIWNDEHELQYKAIVSRSTVNEDGTIKPGEYDQTKIESFFPSMKLQYFGPLKSDGTGLVQHGFHKFNLIPLIPSMIQNTKLESLHSQLIEQGIDYVTFASGSKVSTISNNENGSDKFYNDDRTLNTNLVFTKNPIFTKYLKNQLKIHDHFVGKVTLPTQMRAILVSSIMDNGKPKDYTGTIESWNKLSDEQKIASSEKYKWLLKYENDLKSLVEFKKQELLNDLGITNELSLLENSTKLVNMIRDEFSDKDYTEYQIEFLFENNKLKSDLSTALTAANVEKLLVSLVEKRITKLKVNGEGLIQMASTMSENKDSQWKKATTEEQEKYGTNGLGFYHLKDGKVQAAQVKISLQGDFEKLLDLSGVKIYTNRLLRDGTKRKDVDYEASLANLNRLIKDEEWLKENRQLIRLTAPRIPSQAMNSIEFLEVAEFLPKSAGNIMIVPSEIVAKSGSDFDVDKLFTLFPNLAIFKGKGELIQHIKTDIDKNALSVEKKSLLDKLKLINDEIANHYDNVNFNNSIKGLNREIYELKQSINNLTGNDELTVLELDRLNKDYDTLIQIRQMSVDEIIKNSDLQELNNQIYEAINPLKNEIKIINDRLDNIQREINGSTIKGLENNLLNTIIERLEWSDNYPDLIKPNSIGLVSEVSNTFAESASDFNKYATIDGVTRKRTKGKKEYKAISSTMIYDPAYNINKQMENSVGMDTLGIGAIGSKFFALFTRMGMYMNENNIPSQKLYDEIKKIPAQERTRKQRELMDIFNKPEYQQNYKLRLAHNSTMVNGQSVIDLSNTKNVSGENVSDILGQLINGWVDVAKDAWIFNIQGNKEVAPTLLFLIMSGVDLKEAVTLCSSRLVREYIENKRTMNGSLYGLSITGKGSVEGFEMQDKLIKKYDDKDALNLVLTNLNEPKIKFINDVYRRAHINSELLDIKKLESLILHSHTTHRSPEEKDLELDALYNFIAYEQTAQQMTAVTSVSKFDTTTYSNLAEIRNNKNKFDNLTKDNPALPVNIQEMISSKTPVGMFDTNNLQLSLWQQFFSLKMNPAISKVANDYYRGSLYFPQRNKADNEKDFAEEFISYLYQNQFTVLEDDSYKGFEISPFTSSHSKVKENGDMVEGIIENDKFFYNDEAVDYYMSEGYGSTNTVLKFLIEKTLLQKNLDMNSSEVKNSISYQLALSNMTIGKENDNYNDTLEDNYLTAEALFKSSNGPMMFDGPYTYSARFELLKRKYPSLRNENTLVNDLTTDTNKQGRRNLFLTNLHTAGYNDIYTEQLAILKENTIDPEISDFFNQFDRFAMLQGGVKSFGKYVMTSIIDQHYLDNILSPVMNEIKSEISLNGNLLNDFAQVFYATKFWTEDPESQQRAFKIAISKRKRGTIYENDNYHDRVAASIQQKKNEQELISIDPQTVEEIQAAIDQYKEIQFNVENKYDIAFPMYSLLDDNGYVDHKIMDQDSTYHLFSKEKSFTIKDGDMVSYNTDAGEMIIEETLPEILFENTPVSLTLKDKQYTDMYRYLAAVKSSYASVEEREKLSKVKTTDTTSPAEWIHIINNISLTDKEKIDYNQPRQIMIGVYKSMKDNVDLVNKLLNTDNSLLTVNNNRSQFDRDFSIALMRLRRAIPRPETTNKPIEKLEKRSDLDDKGWYDNIELEKLYNRYTVDQINQILQTDNVQYAQDIFNSFLYSDQDINGKFATDAEVNDQIKNCKS